MYLLEIQRHVPGKETGIDRFGEGIYAKPSGHITVVCGQRLQSSYYPKTVWLRLSDGLNHRRHGPGATAAARRPRTRELQSDFCLGSISSPPPDRL